MILSHSLNMSSQLEHIVLHSNSFAPVQDITACVGFGQNSSNMPKSTSSARNHGVGNGLVLGGFKAPNENSVILANPESFFRIIRDEEVGGAPLKTYLLNTITGEFDELDTSTDSYLYRLGH